MNFKTITAIFIIIGMLIAYLLGSVNFAIIFTKLFKNQDIRKMGSGNAGFTNVLRSVGKAPAILTLFCDFAKGITAIILVRLIFIFVFGEYPETYVDYLVCFSALLGHVFPVFYGFKGGKGILVSFGTIMALSPIAALICLTVFVITLVVSKYVSLGSILAAITFPLAILLLSILQKSYVFEFLYAIPIALTIVLMHHQNIKRLLSHTENKLSIKKN